LTVEDTPTPRPELTTPEITRVGGLPASEEVTVGGIMAFLAAAPPSFSLGYIGKPLDPAKLMESIDRARPEPLDSWDAKVVGDRLELEAGSHKISFELKDGRTIVAQGDIDATPRIRAGVEHAIWAGLIGAARVPDGPGVTPADFSHGGSQERALNVVRDILRNGAGSDGAPFVGPATMSNTDLQMGQPNDKVFLHDGATRWLALWSGGFGATLVRVSPSTISIRSSFNPAFRGPVIPGVGDTKRLLQEELTKRTGELRQAIWSAV
jgi:hypothetical protein